MSSEPWTVLRLIRWSADYLKGKGVEQARLDTEHLLAHSLGSTRLDLYLQYDRPLDAGELARFKALLLRRAAREPLQHVIGQVSFREVELRCDRRALVPRPETEVLVGVVLDAVDARDPALGPVRSALDVGTGSGCIALSLFTEGTFERVVATDVSAEALELARDNAQRCAADIELRLGPLFEPLGADELFDVIVSNPPYIALEERDALEPEVVDFDPHAALFAGREGLDVIRELVAGARAHLVGGGLLALEVGATQTEQVAALIAAAGGFAAPTIHDDLSGRPRIVCAAAL